MIWLWLLAVPAGVVTMAFGVTQRRGAYAAALIAGGLALLVAGIVTPVMVTDRAGEESLEQLCRARGGEPVTIRYTTVCYAPGVVLDVQTR